MKLILSEQTSLIGAISSLYAGTWVAVVSYFTDNVEFYTLLFIGVNCLVGSILGTVIIWSRIREDARKARREKREVDAQSKDERKSNGQAEREAERIEGVDHGQ